MNSVWIVVVLPFGLIGYQLVTGKVLNRNWKPFATSEEKPLVYWSTIGLEFVTTLLVVYLIIQKTWAANH